MTVIKRLAGLVAVGVLAAPAMAQAASQTYVYTVSHVPQGNIGSYSRTIDQIDGATRARSSLKVAVKMMGLVVYRETIDQTEIWRGGRLISFQSVTDANGRRLAVSGEARGGQFFVTSPTGTTAVSADIAAADPWSLAQPGRAQVVSLNSGHVDLVQVSGGETETVAAGGSLIAARHFRAGIPAQPDKWEAWLDAQGVPVKFRTVDSGHTLIFTLVPPSVPINDRTPSLAAEPATRGDGGG